MKSDIDLDCQRACPRCGSICYHLHKYYATKARKLNKICKKCRDNDYKIRFLGPKNPFYGKRHSQETINKIISKTKGRKQTGVQLARSRAAIKIAAQKARENGKTVYERWCKKFGKEIADKKYQALKEKLSRAFSGAKNPMYGKPPPCGSGNGWACWYKNIHFRSLRELMYYVLEIEAKGLKCRSGQSKDLIIHYINWNNKPRTYRADFFCRRKMSN
jgi:hypothetical protein